MRAGHPLTYPLAVAVCALAVCGISAIASAAFADADDALDQLSALILVAAVVLCVTGYSWYAATRRGSASEQPATIQRVRQQHRLTSRSWIEVLGDRGSIWIPVFFDPALITMPTPTTALITPTTPALIAMLMPTTAPITLATTAPVADAGRRASVTWGGRRLYPAGRARRSEPVGRLIDNPSRPDPDGPARARTVARPVRRLTLDAQFAVAAPFVGALWVYVAGGGLAAFVGATCVAAAVGIWFAAIRGSDPS